MKQRRGYLVKAQRRLGLPDDFKGLEHLREGIDPEELEQAHGLPDMHLRIVER